MAATEQKISRTALLAMVVGGMVGAGIFALPSRFGGVTGPVGAVCAICTAFFNVDSAVSALRTRNAALETASSMVS